MWASKIGYRPDCVLAAPGKRRSPPSSTSPNRRTLTAAMPSRATARAIERGALELEQPRLHPAAEGIVVPGAVASDDPVAGDEDRHRVGGERVADGARRTRPPGAARELRVRARLPILDLRGVAEDLRLERREAGEIQRHGEDGATAGEILRELAPRARRVTPAPRRHAVATSAVAKAANAPVGRLDPESADRHPHRGKGTRAPPPPRCKIRARPDPTRWPWLPDEPS